MQKLFRFTDAVVFSFDGDSAGRRAARKALDGALSYASDVRSIKFLFLPAEHDPDSYIREKGSEAFSVCVSQATPLSKFLIEVASEGCDLQSAEGRARLSSNASPLWRALPDGALKRQLLSELAQMIQLDPAELAGLWLQQAEAQALRSQPRNSANSKQPSGLQGSSLSTGPSTHNTATAYDPEAMPSPYQPTAKSSFNASARRARPDGKTWQQDSQGKWRLVDGNGSPNNFSLGPRTQPASRADHAIRIILSNMALWDTITPEDQAMLCDLPAQHGQLMRWIESQFHNHGPLAWGTLLEEIQSQDFAEFAKQLMGDHVPALSGNQPDSEPGEAHEELRLLLNLMLIDRLKELETEALKLAETRQDADALNRWRALHQRRRELMNS